MEIDSAPEPGAAPAKQDFDLREAARAAPQGGQFPVVIILNVAQRVVGAVVASVSDVVELQAADIRPAPEFSTTIDASHILGLGSLKNGDQERC